MGNRSFILFYLNGNPERVRAEHAGMMLADYLRIEKRLTGTKIVCAEGDCGACSVLRLPPNFKASQKNPQFVSINSCITTVAQMDGSSIVTVDALASQNKDRSEMKLTPVQQSMIDQNGSQCGFCTPGFIVAITGLIEKKLCNGKKSGFCTPQEAKNCMTGNLCRCTGYQPIVDAAVKVNLATCESIAKRFTSVEQTKALLETRKTPVFFKSAGFSFYAPTKISDAVKYLTKNKDARLIGAGTDLGVVHNKGKLELTHLVSLHLVPELYDVKKTTASIQVGARINLADLRTLVKKSVPEFANFLDLFASPQIKNVATLVGNIGNASPIADTPPFLLAANAILFVHGPKGKRKIALDEYYLGYRKTALRPNEIITSIQFEIPKKSETLRLYKASQRKDLDISCVNAAFKIARAKSGKIGEMRVALGGVAATPVRLKKTETFLKGKILKSENSLLMNEAVAVLQSEINPLDDVRGTGKFRRALVTNLFLKYFRELDLSVGEVK
jgi:xanthine dehydrogenase small subunit